MLAQVNVCHRHARRRQYGLPDALRLAKQSHHAPVMIPVGGVVYQANAILPPHRVGNRFHNVRRRPSLKFGAHW